MKPTTCVYLHTDRHAALLDFIASRYGIEAPLSFTMPFDWTLRAGGGWPARVLVSLEPKMAPLPSWRPVASHH